jgi:hypothetical protein
MSKKNETESEKIVRGLKMSKARLIAEKTAANLQVVVSRDGVIQRIDPWEL